MAKTFDRHAPCVAVSNDDEHEPWMDRITESVAETKVSAHNGTAVVLLAGFDADGQALVRLGTGSDDELVAARSTIPLRKTDRNKEVVVVFGQGESAAPTIIGLLQARALVSDSQVKEAVQVHTDGERLVIEAEREIVLRCGDASIILTRAGKVIIRGAYILSRSSGVNRIKGGSVQIN